MQAIISIKSIGIISLISISVFSKNGPAPCPILANKLETHEFLCSQIRDFADSIRIEENIPEIGYAVFTGDSIICLNNLGFKNSVTKETAGENDWIHLGSNSKALLGFMAAQLVERHKIAWNTRFFDLFPEYINTKNLSYRSIDLKDLLSHRAGIPGFTEEKDNKKIHLDQVPDNLQRYVFCREIAINLTGKRDSGFSYSNAGYVLATLMLEKVTGESWETLLSDLGHQLNLKTYVGWPNQYDAQQPIGHKNGNPVDMHFNFPFSSCLYPSGNVSMPFKDYVRFLQINLRGLAGDSSYLSPQTFKFIQTGIPTYAIGWAWREDEKGLHYSTHNGSAGTFFCHTFLVHEKHLGIVCWANNVSKKSNDAMVALRKMIENSLP